MKINITGVSDSRTAYYAAKEIKKYKNTLMIVSSEKKARQLQEDLSFFTEKKIVVLPEEDELPIIYEARTTDKLVKRMKALKELATEENIIIIAPAASAVRKLQSPERFISSVIDIKIDDEIDLEEFKKKMIAAGYERTTLTEAPGEFSIRGGIIDIFSPDQEYPVRIELFDTVIDSLRSYDPDNQRSIENIMSTSVCPAAEFMPNDEEIENALKGINKEYKNKIKELKKSYKGDKDDLAEEVDKITEKQTYINEIFLEKTNPQIYADFLDYFFEENSFIWDYNDRGINLIDEPSRIVDAISKSKSKEDFYRVYEKDTVIFTPFPERIKNVPKLDKLVNSKSHQITAYNGQMSMLISDLKNYIRENYDIHIIAFSEERLNKIAEYISDEKIGGKIFYETGSLSSGMVLSDDRICYITESDIFPKVKKRAVKKRKKGKNSIDFSDLHKGDYVVHEKHGIGKFIDIKTLKVDNEVKDYLQIKYAGTDVLYIPTEQMDIIQKYIGNEGNSPKLSKLSGIEWKKSRQKAKAAVMAIAEDLVKLYAERQLAGGYAFSKDTVWQGEFEEDFPYKETDDQLRAVEDIKNDMEEPIAMDRLICGDVGYGKTEVAARAIFKCLIEGKQAALLAPTTLLANQHFYTLKERYEKYPFNVEMLSRFRNNKEQKAIIEDLKAGGMDLVIGTHRLLSDDVKFRDLGLLVVDEEQRFGVKHKEAIKKLKKNVDVLTLSATPIPRTLNMSLTGIKNISMLEEPPEDRYPVQTYVTTQDDELMREIIERELARGGQVFIVYNRVKGIDTLAAKIDGLVEDAVVSVGHGQMDEKNLENVMLDFVEGRSNVLIATTIVENGIDIANANTIIVLNADKFGLSQLYQLRGRVGRSNRLAYAYLMYKPNKVLTEVAKKRLSAIREFTEFGAGFKIAMRDLEIRGAGNILGEAQHGHISNIGYELFCKEIDRAVKQINGETVTETKADIPIEIDVAAHIPREYIENETLKLQVYKKIAQLRTDEEKEDLTAELIDRYGDIPDKTMNLINIAMIRNYCEKLGVEKISDRGTRIIVTFGENNHIKAYALVMIKQKYGEELIIQSGVIPNLNFYVKNKNKASAVCELLKIMYTNREN